MADVPNGCINFESKGRTRHRLLPRIVICIVDVHRQTGAIDIFRFFCLRDDYCSVLHLTDSVNKNN